MGSRNLCKNAIDLWTALEIFCKLSDDNRNIVMDFTDTVKVSINKLQNIFKPVTTKERCWGLGLSL